MAFKKGKSGNPSGRPKGSKTTPRFEEYVTEKDRKQFVEFMMATYMADMNVAKWVGDHLFAKPAQAITGEDGGAIKLEITGMTIVKDGNA